MKRIGMNSKLALNKQTLRALTPEQLGNVAGGATKADGNCSQGCVSNSCPAVCVQPTEYSCDGVIRTRTCITITL